MTIEVRKADGYRELSGDSTGAPVMIPITYELGSKPVDSYRVSVLSVDSWQEQGKSGGFATIALLAPSRLFGIFVPQSADELRGLAASLLRAASTLDGGKGVQ